MTQNASLHVVRKTDHEVVFQINAPAVAAALTRSEGKPSQALTNRLESALLSAGVVSPEPSELPLCEIARGESGKWYVRVPRVTCKPCSKGHECTTREQLRSKKAERISRRDVPDNDGRIAGKFSCGKCAGTGRYITYIENGVPKGPGGECYRCGGKGFHTQADRRRNYGADINYVPRSC